MLISFIGICRLIFPACAGSGVSDLSFHLSLVMTCCGEVVSVALCFLFTRGYLFSLSVLFFSCSFFSLLCIALCISVCVCVTVIDSSTKRATMYIRVYEM